MNTWASQLTTPSPTTLSCSGNSFRIVSVPRTPLIWINTYLDLVDIPPSQVNILDGNAEDLVQECKRYEERIKQYGGIELFLGGIGEDGHIAFNVGPWLSSTHPDL